MKKLFVLSATLVILVSGFAQTDSKAKKSAAMVEGQPKKEVKKVETKAAAATSKTVKPVAKKGAAVAEKVEAMPKVVNTPVETIKETPEKPNPQLLDVPVPQQVAPTPAPLVDPNKDFEFKNDAYDFGKIPAGKAAKYELFIKNVSKETQELTLVQPGCGCTTPEYQQNQKILPGETAVVKLGFNGGAPGNGQPFSKSVTVTLKGHSPKVVTFKGETYTVPTESAPANNGTEKLKPEGK